jgi:uncharacterized protein (TIGR00369 family)
MDLDPGRSAGDLVACPYGTLLGVALDRAEPGAVRLRIADRADNRNRNGTLHGGVIASLAHMTGAAAARTVAGDDGAGADVAVVELSVQFVAVAGGEDVAAAGRVVRRGREFVFAEVAVDGATGEPVARALVASRSARRETETGLLGRRVRGEASGLDADATARLATARFSGSPFSARLRIASARLEGGGVVAVLPWQGGLADHGGRVHEGALATLVDAAGGAAAWAVEGFDARGRAATIAMHLTFGAATRGEDVVAVARPAWRAGEIYSAAVDLLGRASGRALATGGVVYRIVRP